MSEVLKELRSALNAKTSQGGVDPAFDAPTINAKIDAVIADLSPKFSELYSMIPKRSTNGQPTHIWNVRISDNTSTRWSYTASEQVASDTNTNTPAQGEHKQLTAIVKTLRTDWEVENFYRDASSSYYDAVADEVRNAVEAHVDKVERQLVAGTQASSNYGNTSGFLGLKQIVSANEGIGDTTSVYGITRAAGTQSYMDARVVDANSSDFVITFLDNAITKARKERATPGFFLVSYERHDEINAQLQAQQRFNNQTMNIPGGFVVTTYQGIPLIRSRYMDKIGASNTDTALFLIAKDNLFLYELTPMRNVIAELGRVDAFGGFIKQAAVLVSPRLTHNVIVNALTTPQV